MVKKIVTKLLMLVSNIAIISAVTSVNSTCFLWTYEEKAPEEAYKLVR